MLLGADGSQSDDVPANLVGARKESFIAPLKRMEPKRLRQRLAILQQFRNWLRDQFGDATAAAWPQAGLRCSRAFSPTVPEDGRPRLLEFCEASRGSINT